MNPVRMLLRLHPASFRERWGTALEADAHADTALSGSGQQCFGASCAHSWS